MLSQSLHTLDELLFNFVFLFRAAEVVLILCFFKILNQRREDGSVIGCSTFEPFPEELVLTSVEKTAGDDGQLVLG